MEQTRRQLLVGAVTATVGAAMLGERAAAAPNLAVSADMIAELFADLPGTLSFRVLAPATTRSRRLDVSLNPGQQLFVASAIKVFILVEALRQADGPDVVATLAGRQLALDASVWSVDSPVLNAPDLTGTVSERTAMEAMISHSDNTATDIMLKQAGPDAVRAFLASAGFTSTAIPDSTRSYFGYLKGATDYQTFTWEQLVATADDPFVNPVLNPTSTLASSADDLVSVYSRAMPGEFFEHDETLNFDVRFRSARFAPIRHRWLPRRAHIGCPLAGVPRVRPRGRRTWRRQ
jgi:beta-lactamase class A